MSSVAEPPSQKKPADDGKSVIDMSKMNEGQRAALQVTEAARESHDDISFVANLFMGRWKPEKLYPLTDIDAEEKPRAEKFLADLAAFLREKVDADLIDRTGEIPEEVQAGFRQLGAYGIKVPQKYGGLGFSQTTYCRACLLMASHCANTFAHLSVHQSIGVAQPILLFGTEEQKKKFLPRSAAGELAAFALTEKGVGSDPARLTTEAKPDGDDFILNGEKLWCSNGTRAGLLIVACKTPPKMVDGKPRTQITTFVVEAKSPGIDTRSRPLGLAWRCWARACAPSTSAASARAWSSTPMPKSVIASLRVLRWSSRSPKRFSSAAMRRETVDLGSRTRSAARLKLPASATRANSIRSLASRSIMA